VPARERQEREERRQERLKRLASGDIAVQKEANVEKQFEEIKKLSEKDKEEQCVGDVFSVF
jgi:hypothetical protein